MYAQDNNSLPVWIILSQAHHHISTNSQPFLVGIVSELAYKCGKHEYGPQRRPDGTLIFFGVNVTDVSHSFSSDEFNDLGPRGQAYIFQERESALVSLTHHDLAT